MPAIHGTPVLFALRLLAGVAGALVFVVAVNSLPIHLREHPARRPSTPCCRAAGLRGRRPAR
ncbi:hypothetical protein [Streptomyces camelliae]|uniref:Major facilitator superfamily (MFS) profile domain-containing protein n=1 Tax=Streptomyces camelliae TaxID=3004093 RepID=A0ABY7PCZ7_9ACTN|nr:hypothetical protein [Streptomyces sp. HUAS 2-6]WBO68461.1 hypothetical protein O1G22_39415 [Streptomyces sp. HUAS 2-6]